MKNFKLFNFRPFVFGLIALIVGVFLAYSFFVSFWFIVGFGILLLLAVVLVVKRKWYKFLRLHLTATIIIAVCFVLGFGVFGIRELVYRKNVAPAGTYYISAKVVGVQDYSADNGKWKTSIDSIKLYNVSDENKLVLSVNESSYVWLNTELEVGDKIVFVGNYEPIDHDSIKNISPNHSSYFAQYSSVSVIKNSKTISQQFKSRVWTELSKHTDEDRAGTLFAMLVGDKTNLSKNVKDSYYGAGVGHILAVSGLHVGFVVLLASFILDLLRFNKKLKFAFMVILLALYSWMCGFSYSVLRASIMCIVLLYANMRGRQYDRFSALAFATILILAFDPYQLFTAGFLLSFFAVFGIVCLYDPLSYYLSKAYPEKLSNTIAIGIATSICILPWQIYFFGYFPIFAVLTNLFVVPIATLAYFIAVLVMPFALIWSPIGALLKASAFLFGVVGYICSVYNVIDFAKIETHIHSATIIIWYSSVFVCSDYLFIKGKKYYRLAAIVIALLLFGLNIGGVF